MVWRSLFVLICLFFSGCYGQELPVDIYIDSNFEPDEQGAILRAINALEVALGERVGERVFYYRGLHDDENFGLDDLDDGIHNIYQLREETPVTRYPEDMINDAYYYPEESYHIHGYGLHTDVMLYWYRFIPDNDFECATNDYYCDQEMEPESIEELRNRMLYRLEELTMHELGHFLGMGHNNIDPESIMNIEYSAPYPETQVVPETDIEALCVFYDC